MLMSSTPCSRLEIVAPSVLAGVKAKPCGWPAASLDPSSRRRISKQCREQGGNGMGRSGRGVELSGSVQVLDL
jgi:hypothetical protein